MNITELYVENNKVDVYPDLSTLITFSINDVKDFTAKNTAWSKTVVLPGTGRNNQIFGNIFSIGSGSLYDSTKPNISTNYNVAKSAQVIMFQGNIQVFKGVLRILKIIIDRDRVEYEVGLIGELGGLIYKLGNLKLEDLDFSAYDHTYNTTNINNSWMAAKGSGYYYPLIDYGTYSTNKHDWDIRTFRPALYAKEYIDKIFAKSGYSYKCDLFNTPRFKSLIIPHNTKVLSRSTSNVFNANITSTVNVIDYSHSNIDDVPFNSFSGTLFSDISGGVKKKFQYTGTAPLNITASLSYSGNYTAPGCYITGSFLKNGVAVTGAVKVFNQTGSAGSSFNIPMYWNFNAPLSLVQNDTIELQFQTSDSTSGHNYTVNASLVGLSLTTQSPVLVPVGVGDTVNINTTIPKNILQKDFISSIVKLFNLYIYEDKDQLNTILIKPYIDFMNTSLASAVDWTYKLNREKPIQVEPMSELNSRYYEFKYKSDSDYYNDQYQKRYNQNYGEYLYDSAYEFANEKQSIELIFSGTPLVGYNGEDKVYPTIFKRTGTSPVVEENTDSNIRIMQSKYIVSSTSYPINSWTIKDGSSVLATLTEYGYAGHFDDPNAPGNDLNFGATAELYFTLVSGALNVNQFNVYWSPYMAGITDKDSRLVTASFRLKYTDIAGLDFSKYIYIDGILYMLNAIEDYNATMEDECKVSLLKINDSNSLATTPVLNYDDVFTSYVGTGTEGKSIVLRQLQNNFITLIFKGEKIHDLGIGTLGVNQYSFNQVSGQITFGTNIEAGQVIQILYRTS